MKMTLAERCRKFYTKWIGGRKHKTIAYCPHFCRFCDFRNDCSFDAEYEFLQEMRQAYRKGVTHGTYKDLHKEGIKQDNNN